MESFLIFAVIGIAAGVTAGLLGVGGGIIMVPAVLFVLLSSGISESVAVHMSVGTSLSVIAVTGLSSAYGHWQRGSVNRSILFLLIPGLLVGAVLGGVVADAVSGTYLRRAFGIFVIVVGLKMLINTGLSFRRLKPSGWIVGGSGTVIGGVSAFFGVGGGILSVPWLQYIGIEMREAIGTSAACGVPIALAGALTFIVMGRGLDTGTSYSLGYVFWPASLMLGVFTIPFARIGVGIAHRVPQKSLKKVFGLLLLSVGCYLVI